MTTEAKEGLIPPDTYKAKLVGMTPLGVLAFRIEGGEYNERMVFGLTTKELPQCTVNLGVRHDPKEPDLVSNLVQGAKFGKT